MKPRANRSTAAGSLPGRHVDDIVLHETGDHGDAIAAPAAGPVDADGLHTHVALQPPRLVDATGDGPPQTGVGLVQLPGERAGGQVAGRLHRPRLEQEREPAAGPGPRGGHRPHPVLGARDAGHGGVDERLVPEEVRMPPHTPPPVMHRAGVLPAARLGTMEAGAGLEADHDAQLPPAAVGVTEAHGPHLPRRLQPKRGGEQVRGIHASNLPDRHHPAPKPPTTNSERPILSYIIQNFMSSYIYNLSTGPSPCGECFDGVQPILAVCFVEVVPVR